MTYIIERKRRFEIVARRRFPPKVVANENRKGGRTFYTREYMQYALYVHRVNYV